MNVDDWLSQQQGLDDASKAKVRQAYETDLQEREKFKQPIAKDSQAVIIGAQGMPGGIAGAT